MLSILKSLKSDIKNQDRNSKILIVDSMNTFIRCFAANNSTTSTGIHVGGLVGFLNSLGSAIKYIQPTRVILVFDGVNSSINRKNIYSDYKNNRHNRIITKWGMFDSPDEEESSMSSQMFRLVSYIKRLPIEILSFEKTEADDIISYVSSLLTKENNHTYIMSTDQDFLQLVSDNVSVFSPTKKIIYTPFLVTQEFNTTPINFLTRKILLGDSSDNIPGIKGLGPKKLEKLFPELKESHKFTLDNVYNKCSNDLNIPMYSSIITFFNQLEINKKLMDLSNPHIDDNTKEKIQETLEYPYPTLHVGEFLSLHNEDNLEKFMPYPENWLNECFNRLNNFNKK